MHVSLPVICCAALLLAHSPCTSAADAPDTLPETEASAILASVRDQLPAQPLLFQASLIGKNKRGQKTASAEAELFMDYSSPTGYVRYTLFDAFGEETDQLEITRPPLPAPALIHYSRHGKTAELPSLNSPIHTFDFTWGDLCMNFLWWKQATVIGFDEKLNRPCWIIEAIPDTPSDQLARVQLWIDQDSRALLQAEAFDAANERVKTMQIKTIRKINDLRIPGDIEIRTYPSRSKTRLRIRNVE